MSTKSWSWLHRWSSLVCTAFMLLLCLTGLPLIFHHEIAHTLGRAVEPAPMPMDAPMRRCFPGLISKPVVIDSSTTWKAISEPRALSCQNPPS